MMIPTYLNDLELPQVFSLSSQDVVNYIQESNKDEHIVDSESQRISGFVTATFGQYEDAAQKYFSVENPTAMPFALLQVDNGLIKSHDVRKCDCIIVNDAYIGFKNIKSYRSNVEAFICFRQGYPKTKSSQINYRVRFKDDTGIPLSFDRKKIL